MTAIKICSNRVVCHSSNDYLLDVTNPFGQHLGLHVTGKLRTIFLCRPLDRSTLRCASINSRRKMAKRPLEGLDGAERKKAKVDHQKTKAEANGVVSEAKVSVEERRERKRLKRKEQRSIKGADDGNITEPVNGIEHTTSNGIKAPKGVEKPRKERKKKDTKDKKPEEAAVGGLKRQDVADMVRRAMQNNGESPDGLGNAEPDEGVVENSSEDRAAAKAARKAEKAKRKSKVGGSPKALEDGLVEHIAEPTDALAPDETQGTGSNISNPPREEIDGDIQEAEDTSIPKSEGCAAKAARKAERAEKKMLKAAKTAGKDAAAPSPLTSISNDVQGSKGKSKSPSTARPTKGSQYTEDAALASLPQSSVTAYLNENFITITDPTTTTPLRPIISFAHLASNYTASPSPFAAFKTPTPIQSASWPFLFSGRDVIGVAETGSGKTLAFGVPCIRSLQSSTSNVRNKQKNQNKSTSSARAVIISPTRELAVQIHEQLSSLATPAGLSTACIYGGVPKETQRTALATAHIIVATPGRLNDLIDEGHADLSLVHYLVLDEADRMLDKGFEDQIRNILTHTPSTTSGRQTLMFTATWPPSVRALAATFTTSPVHIAIGANNPTGELRANTRITQKVEVVAPEDKQARMLQLIKTHQPAGRILAFCLYKKEATRIESFLRSRHLPVAAIHGDMPQSARLASLEAFKSGACPLLVATDVAARGLDIPEVKLVLNITFPLTAEDYVHRIGRTGRAGKEGLAITLFTVHDKGQSGALVNVLRAAGQVVPKELLDFGGTVKKREHGLYGKFVKEVGEGERREGVKIRFE